ncbi:MerR family transcriptional regulator [Sporofaciens sp. SGI.106]|uniref:MerR family transcriptional regulator n=1 Tax=Sporofaciens sp. SGI.106 TaxID=3420568 RepID=UPI002A93DC5A|nr:MerR family transcriptional regulator [Lachnoclostridium sp.]
MKHYYRIGEISRLYNIGPDSLRYYEELGILKPHRGENNYRMYHIHDLWRLNVIRDLRELGFSMEKIKDYLNNRSLASTKAMLQEELDVINNKMQALADLKANIEDRLETLHDTMTQPLGIIEKKELPVRHCHTIHSGYKIDVEMDLLIKQLLNKDKDKLYIIGNNRIGSVIPLESAKQGLCRHYTDVFIIDKDGRDTIPGGIYLTVSYRGDCAQNAEYIPALFRYADEQGLTPEGPVLELLWTDIHQTDEEEEHVTELQVRCV